MVTTVRSSTTRANVARTVAPSASGVGRQGAEPGPCDDLSAQQLREISSLAHRLHEIHPDVSLPTISSLVQEAYAKLADARVQTFRMILTERLVRRRLESAPNQRRG
jgi:hypothetical protein